MVHSKTDGTMILEGGYHCLQSREVGDKLVDNLGRDTNTWMLKICQGHTINNG